MSAALGICEYNKLFSGAVVSLPFGFITPIQQHNVFKHPCTFKLLMQTGFLCCFPALPQSLVSAAPLHGARTAFPRVLPSCLPPSLEFQGPALSLSLA